MQLTMLTALSVVLGIVFRFPLFASFLEYDMADIPIIMSALLFGNISALLVLFAVSFIQAFLLGGNGWIGLIMHFFASAGMVICINTFYRRKKKNSHLIFGMLIASLIRTALMIPLNYIFTVHFFGVSIEQMNTLIYTAIIPFNLVKAGINSFVTIFLFLSLSIFIKRNKNMVQPK